MKKIWHSMLCGGALAALLCTPALAAGEGDFSLVVNGEPVSFTDALPQLRENRSFLPMAATFQALGYEDGTITWDNDARTVTAEKDGVTLLLAIGKQEIKVTGPEGEETIPTDVAPYIDPASDRTYIPVGLVADALDYSRQGLVEDVSARIGKKRVELCLQAKAPCPEEMRRAKVKGDLFEAEFGRELRCSCLPQ